MKQITVRKVDEKLSRALQEEARRRRRSVNQLVLDILRRELGLDERRGYDNGLGRLAGQWSGEEANRFERNIAFFEEVDEELWK